MPDLALITFNEMHENARMIASIASADPVRVVPVIADADTGFGSPLNISRTTAAYITSNVAAMHIEDQFQNKRCGHLGGKQLVPLETFATRIRAAALTRQRMARDIIIIARTDCLQILGFDEAIQRMKAAITAGADVAFVEGIPDADTGKRVCKALEPVPVLLNIVTGGITPDFSLEEAQSMGMRIIIHPVLALSPVFRVVTESMRQLKTTGRAPPPQEGDGTIRDIFNICGLPACVEFDNNAGGEMLDKHGV